MPSTPRPGSFRGQPTARSKPRPAPPDAPAPAGTTRPAAPDNARPGAAHAPWPSPHLLGLQGLAPAHLRAVLARARAIEQQMARPAGVNAAPVNAAPVHAAPVHAAPPALHDTLRGRVVANLFFEDSTRTRMSFSLAAQRLGATVMQLSSTDSSVNKGETIRDTAANVAAMGVDAMVVRHRASGAAALVARAVWERWGCSIINAGDGRHEHPTQGLLDAYTIAESFDRLDTFDLAGLTVVIVGDAGSSRVARSDIAAMTALGAHVVVVGPPALVPASLASLGCRVCHDLDDVIEHADAINVLRIQFERHAQPHAPATQAPAPQAHERVGGAALARSQALASLREYTELYGLTPRRAERMKPTAVVLHPGPINRGVEMSAAVADGDRSVVLKQVGHGVAVRMAVLELCLSAPRPAAVASAR